MLLAVAVLVHSAVLVVQLHLAGVTVGGAARLAAPLWLLGLIPVAIAAALALAGDAHWFGWAGPAWACLIASGIAAEVGKPPKPWLTEVVRPAMRPRLRAVGAALLTLTAVLCLLEALVLLPLRSAPGSLPDGWRAIAAAGGPSSPLAAAAVIVALIVVPLALGGLGARRWARSERSILGWAGAGALVAVMLTHGYGVWLAADLSPGIPQAAARGIVLPLLAGVLLHFLHRAGPDTAPLPPASVPLPPGPWHVRLDADANSVPKPRMIP
ncbi:hypothetical protein [Agrococcus sp. Ld7]|uniref:hypothetical protein n=1 Tax=Agrococcus sp. Ld7 TaxID=649148 RepID=UPI00386B0115